MKSDRERLLRTLRSIEQSRKHHKPIEIRLAQLVKQIEESITQRKQRVENVPKPNFPDDLPVVQKRDAIKSAINDNQVIVLCGETGSGKTTQIPKIVLELGRGIDGFIGHTQPRRVAARSVARRIAQELQSPLAKSVGYKIRFSDYTSPDCYIKIMTDGILLAETQKDRLLQQYDTIIIDEAHERSLNIDFLLGYLKQILPKRPDLKIIVMSATIDPERFSEHFDDAPIVEVSGRTFPVETCYRPVVIDSPNARTDPSNERTLQDAILDAVDELALCDSSVESKDGYRTSGDILIFLPGERDIRETAESLRKHHPPETEILPLYARLSGSEQDRIFKPHTGRRIVLATNVAETSLTVPGIRYVIDPGYARISRYSRTTKVQRLPIEPISQASADQRAGRCGRLSAGVCIRLYSEEDFKQRDPFTDPEIVRSNLAGVILQMKALRLGKVEHFPFIEPPDSRLIRDGYQTLHELGAIDDYDELTTLGKTLARFPVDPRIGRMLLAAVEEESLSEILIIASALSIQDPRERPTDSAAAADQSHAEFRDKNSDFLSFINLWNFYHDQARHLSKSQLRKLCRRRFLSYLRLREWDDIHTQLKTLMRQLGHSLNEKPAEYDAVHRALLAGLVSNVGLRTEKYEYTGPRSIKFNIFPGSILFKSRPKWIVASELVRTTKLFARTAATIQPKWIEEVAPHLLKHTYSDPHFEKNGARVAAFEKLSLWGLPIIERRRVHYGPIDPVESRRIFIQHALVQNEYRTGAPFAKHNRNLIKQAEEIKARTRRHDMLYDDSLIFAFYDARIPVDVYNGPLFEKWRRKVERNNKRLLFMNLTDVLGESSTGEDLRTDYPDHLVVHDSDDVRIRLRYLCDPGSTKDGITAIIPLEMLPSLNMHEFDYLVPGFLPEKIKALIRTLPKSTRTALQPTADFVEEFLQSEHHLDQPLMSSIVDFARRRRGVFIDTSEFRPDDLPPYLFMRFKIIDQNNRTAASGRDLQTIIKELQPRIAKALTHIPDSAFNRTGITQWDFGTVPESVEIKQKRLSVCAFPALVDQQTSVALQLFQSMEEALSHHREGLLRLATLELGRSLLDQSKNLPHFGELSINYATLGPSSELRAELIDLIVDRALFPATNEAGESDWVIRTKDHFDRRLVGADLNLYDCVAEVCSLARTILKAYHEVDAQLNNANPPRCDESLDDVEFQIGQLLRNRFFINTPFDKLIHFPRYLAGVSHRLSKLARTDITKDLELIAEVRRFWNPFLKLEAQRKADRKPPTPNMTEFRFLIEEYRISLFAQHLGTAAPVSAKRLRKRWQELV